MKKIFYKGFDKNLKCRDFQYELGKEYEEKEASLCSKGFHACEDPLDTFSYYPPSQSRYAEVELDATSETSDDSKRVGKRIKILSELSFKSLIEACIKFRFEKCTWSEEDKATGYKGAASATGDYGAASATGDYGAASATGDQGAASATGDYGAASATGDYGAASATGYKGAASATGDYGAASATGYKGAASATGFQGAASATGYKGAASATGNYGAASATGYKGAASATGSQGAASATGFQGAASATGDYGAASATGDQGAASATGEQSIALAAGKNSRAKGKKGCWLVLTERDDNWEIVIVKSVKVDGKKIKEDTYYTLKYKKVIPYEE